MKTFTRKKSRTFQPKWSRVVVCLFTMARRAWNALNGVFPVYKPQAVSWTRLRRQLEHRLLQDLNDLSQSTPRLLSAAGQTNLDTVDVNMAAHSNKGPDAYSLQLTHSSVPSFINHSRVNGPLYRHIKIGIGHRLDTMSSGVLVMAVGNGNKLLPEFQKARFTRTYTLHGRLGFATKDFSDSGQVIEKATYEVHCVNETCSALRRIIHEIGLELRAAASCVLVRRTFEQPFGVDDALLPAQWGLTPILNSIHRGQPAITRFFARLLSSPQPMSEDISSYSTGHQN
uniref:TruB pseudouridine (psi) synthase family member 2 n=1 Tax=Eptatretus burgeri TaxID=7764 RepID=A0A8C4R7I1_EPTBU